MQVPHDRPVVSQRMIETWIESAEQGVDDGFKVQPRKQQQQQDDLQAAGSESATAQKTTKAAISVS